MNILESLAVGTGLLTTWYSLKQNRLTWPFGILSVSLYAVIFFQVKLYADMGLQVIYIFLMSYGWWCWQRDTQKHDLPIALLTRLQILQYTLIWILGSVILMIFLHRYTDSQMVTWDVITTVGSLIAQYFLARKIIYTWHLWFVIDLAYVGIYSTKHLYMTSILYLLFSVMALMGFIWWRESYQRQAHMSPATN